jgi:hypothetical protein
VSPFEAALPDLRNKIVNRLVEMSWLHSRNAWERRRRDPISPHALVFFYAEAPAADPPRCELRIAQRLFLGADEPRLPVLLYQMIEVARTHLGAGGDPRREMSTVCDDMSAHAVYVGVGVSSLDTPAGTWVQIQRRASGELDVPGRCYAWLIDDSLLQVDRLASRGFGTVDIWSTHRLATVSRQPVRRWSYAHHLSQPERLDAANRAILHRLGQLHHVISGR